AAALTLHSGGAGGDLTVRGRVAHLDASIGGGSGLTLDTTEALTLGHVTAQGTVSLNARRLLADPAGSGITGNAIRLDAAEGIGTQAERIRTTAQSLVLQSDGAAFIDHQGDLLLSGRVEHT